jgi:hypothetical protein
MSERNRPNQTPSRQPAPAPVDRKVITPLPQRPSQLPGGGQHGYVPVPAPPPKPTKQK